MKIQTRKIKDGTEIKMRLLDEELLFLKSLFGGLNTSEAQRISDKVEPELLTYNIYEQLNKASEEL